MFILWNEINQILSIITFPGAPNPAEQQTKETISRLSQTPLLQVSAPGQTAQMPGQTPNIPGLTAPVGDATQATQFAQTQMQGQTPLLPGQPLQPSPLAPPPLPVSPFASNLPMGQKPLMPMAGIPLDNGKGM